MLVDEYSGSLRQFMTAFGQPVDRSLSDFPTLALGARLIAEEAKEVDGAFVDYATENTKEKAEHLLKELADLVYVCHWLAVACSLPLKEAFKRVHESNMSKLGEDGKPIKRADGKVLKGPHYHEPDLSDLV